MINSEKIYTGLCIIFVSLIIVGNLTYQKFVALNLPFHRFELSVGAVLYPLTFLITDIITELYNKEKAMFCVRFAIFMNIFIAAIIAFMDYLPATTWSKIDNGIFHNVFGYYNVAFIGSIIACYCSQAIDVHLYQLIRNLTNGKHLWLRSNVSTCISLFIDTAIVIVIMTTFGIFPIQQMWALIINSYSWKLFFATCSTPLFYIGIFVIKYFTNLKTVN